MVLVVAKNLMKMKNMNLNPKHDSFNKSNRPKFYSVLMVLLMSTFYANAQVKKPTTTVKTTAPAATTPAKPNTAVTAPPKKATGIDDLVHVSSTKILTLHDPEFKSTAKHEKRKATYAKSYDDTAKKKINGVTLKFVRNPSFGNAPTIYKAKTKKGSDKSEKSTDKSGAQWDCSSSSVSLTANSSNFLNADYAGQAGAIYPGAIYTFDDFFSGNQKEMQGVRYPMQLVIENPNISGSAYVNVKSPTLGTITNAVDKLTNELRGPAATESFTSTTYQTSNSNAQSLQVSGGGSYDGFSASTSVSTGSESNTVNVTIDATKILYSLNVAPPDSGFFKDPKIENTRNLMVIGRVSYGVRVLANFTYTFNSTQDAINFKASYSGFGASANVNLNDVSNSSAVSSNINCYVVGGPGNSTLSFNKKELEKQLKAVFSGATYSNAKPISYSFYSMSDDLIGSYSATDDFNERNCVPNTNAAKLESAYITYTTSNLPGENKDDDTHYHVIVYSGNAGSRNGYNGYDNNPPQTVNNGEPFLLAYKTGPLNITFNGGTSHTDPLTFNAYLTQFLGLTSNPTMDFFVKNGGLVHFHIYPNGNDTWGISGVVLTLNFAGGLTQKVTWGGNGPDVLVLTQNSTEGTLYFDGTFKPRP